ncbi:hypothetical protein EG68_06331, partial [Paragonimus skrjabini miyazakii]
CAATDDRNATNSEELYSAPYWYEPKDTTENTWDGQQLKPRNPNYSGPSTYNLQIRGKLQNSEGAVMYIGALTQNDSTEFKNLETETCSHIKYFYTIGATMPLDAMDACKLTVRRGEQLQLSTLTVWYAEVILLITFNIKFFQYTDVGDEDPAAYLENLYVELKEFFQVPEHFLEGTVFSADTSTDLRNFSVTQLTNEKATYLSATTTAVLKVVGKENTPVTPILTNHTYSPAYTTVVPPPLSSHQSVFKECGK